MKRYIALNWFSEGKNEEGKDIGYQPGDECRFDSKTADRLIEEGKILKPVPIKDKDMPIAPIRTNMRNGPSETRGRQNA